MNRTRRLLSRRKPSDQSPRSAEPDPTPVEEAPPRDRPAGEASVDKVIEESEAEAAERRTEEEEEIFPAYDQNEEEGSRLNPVQRFLGQRDTVPEAEKQTVRIEIPSRTIIKVILTLVLIWLALQVASIFLLLLLAIIVCLALLPLVRRLENRGMPRGVAVATVFSGLLAIVAGFLWLIVPPLITQTQNLIDNAPEYIASFDEVLDRYPSVREQVNAYLGIEDEPESPLQQVQTDEESESEPPVNPATVTEGATRVISIGTTIVGGMANAFFVLVLALYLLVEGERTWRYFARYMTPTLRYRFHRLGPQLTSVVSGYVIGQAIISALFGVFSFIVL
ncbi:MAG TPA: AI-2E family transporter, partial [Cryptosporangiaceae bacterium]|nr:AI-2E family transporter [Cryptosporangiaceae bacterium]